MPRYYFHIAGDSKTQDKVGEDFDTPGQAMAHAKRVAADLARNTETYRGHELCVTNDKDAEIARVPIEFRALLFQIRIVPSIPIPQDVFCPLPEQCVAFARALSQIRSFRVSIITVHRRRSAPVAAACPVFRSALMRFHLPMMAAHDARTSKERRRTRRWFLQICGNFLDRQSRNDGDSLALVHREMAEEQRMRKVSDYRTYAEECRALARNAQSVEHRDLLLKRAVTWAALAQEREEQLGSDTKGVAQ